MLTLDSAGNITAMTNAFGGELLIESDKNAYGIALRGLPAEACIDIATQDWNSLTSSWYKGIAINDIEKQDMIKAGNVWDTLAFFTTPSICSYVTYGAISFACGEKNVFSIDDAVTACSCSGDKCVIMLAFAK